MPARSSSWTPASYAGVQAGDEYYEYFECNGALWKQAWDYEHQCNSWCEVRRDDGFCFLPAYRHPWELFPMPPHGHGFVNRPVLGAVQVRVHVRLYRVRDGVLLRVPRRCCPCEHAAQVPAVRSDDSGLPRLQFIDRVGHCSYATVTGISLVQTVQKTVKISSVQFLARLLSSRCCASTGAGVRQCCLVEVPLLQFIDSRRHPCHGGPDSALWSCRRCSFSTVVEMPVVAQRHDWSCKLRENSSTFHECSFQRFFFRCELITQVMSSISLRDCRCMTGRCGHTLAKAHTETTTKTGV